MTVSPPANEVRRLMLAGGMMLANSTMAGLLLADKCMLGTPKSNAAGQIPAANVWVAPPPMVQDGSYARWLDMASGIATVSYLGDGGGCVTRRVFSSAASNITVLRLDASEQADGEWELWANRTGDDRATISVHHGGGSADGAVGRGGHIQIDVAATMADNPWSFGDGQWTLKAEPREIQSCVRQSATALQL